MMVKPYLKVISRINGTLSEEAAGTLCIENIEIDKQIKQVEKQTNEQCFKH